MMKLFQQLNARDFTNGNSRSEIIRASVLANDNSRVWLGSSNDFASFRTLYSFTVIFFTSHDGSCKEKMLITITFIIIPIASFIN